MPIKPVPSTPEEIAKFLKKAGEIAGDDNCEVKLKNLTIHLKPPHSNQIKIAMEFYNLLLKEDMEKFTQDLAEAGAKAIHDAVKDGFLSLREVMGAAFLKFLINSDRGSELMGEFLNFYGLEAEQAFDPENFKIDDVDFDDLLKD